MNYYLYVQMGFGSLYVCSPRMCFSTEDYNEWMNKHYHNNDDDDEKTISTWFYLPYGDECEKYREFTNNICSHRQSHRLLVTCTYCQNDFKTFNDRAVRCSSCRWSIKRKLETFTFEKFKKLASVYNIKRRKQEYIIDDLVQKVENYIL